MGHLFDGGFLKADNKEDAINEGISRAEDFAFCEGDRLEGSDNYHGCFKYYDEKFETEDEALDWFCSLGSYVDGVVRVKCLTKATQDRYNARIYRWQIKKDEIIKNYIENFKQRKSATISCRYCGHRHTKEEALRRNLHCFSCNKQMLPDSILKRIENCNDRIKMIQDDYRQDLKDNGDYRYYAKYEVHC